MRVGHGAAMGDRRARAAQVKHKGKYSGLRSLQTQARRPGVTHPMVQSVQGDEFPQESGRDKVLVVLQLVEAAPELVQVLQCVCV